VTIPQFEENVNVFQQQLTNLSNCLLNYENLLDSVKTWSDEVSSSLADDWNDVELSSASKLYTTLDNECATASYIFKHNFGPSLQALANQVGLMYDTSVSLDDIDSSVFSALTSINDNLQTSIQDAYHQLLDKFGQINDYMDSGDRATEDFLRGLGIWRHPYINLENQQVGQ
jgi:hypothetical protein